MYLTLSDQIDSDLVQYLLKKYSKWFLFGLSWLMCIHLGQFTVAKEVSHYDFRSGSQVGPCVHFCVQGHEI